MRKVSLSSPSISIKDRYAVDRVLRSANLAQGKNVKTFEENFSELVDGRPCVALNAGTSALHAALLSLGIGPNDEVIVPSFTFAATANAVALTGATPIFADIDIETFNISAKEIIAKKTAKTRAVIVVHLYGLPADMNEISRICDEFSLLLIEDAAQAHLASIDGKPVGSFGHAAMFSFYATKNMTSGEGGMAVFKDEETARICRLYRNQGMEKKYENEIVGYNYRMTEMQAALGVSQLKNISKWTEIRKSNAEFLNEKIHESDNIVLPITPDGFNHVFHQYTVRIKTKRDLVQSHLSNDLIDSAVYYPKAVHKLPSYGLVCDLPKTEIATIEALSLPIHSALSRRELHRISDSINRFKFDL